MAELPNMNKIRRVCDDWEKQINDLNNRKKIDEQIIKIKNEEILKIKEENERLMTKLEAYNIYLALSTTSVLHLNKGYNSIRMLWPLNKWTSGPLIENYESISYHIELLNYLPDIPMKEGKLKDYLDSRYIHR